MRWASLLAHLTTLFSQERGGVGSRNYLVLAYSGRWKRLLGMLSISFVCV